MDILSFCFHFHPQLTTILCHFPQERYCVVSGSVTCMQWKVHMVTWWEMCHGNKTQTQTWLNCLLRMIYAFIILRHNWIICIGKLNGCGTDHPGFSSWMYYPSFPWVDLQKGVSDKLQRSELFNVICSGAYSLYLGSLHLHTKWVSYLVQRFFKVAQVWIK